jgi:SRSO17 transposase
MITIGKIPKKLKRFFKPLKQHFTKKPWEHFWALVMAITVSHGATIDRLTRTLRGTTHRTNHGEFLSRAAWDESLVIQQIALNMLGSLRTKKDRRLFLIIDETQTLKNAKIMDAVGTVHLHSSRTYAKGHMILKACLYYRGVTIPWGSWLYVKKQHTRKLRLPFRKLTELAAEAIRTAAIPDSFNVTVLFDSFYLCPKVVKACKERKWHYIGVAKANRNFTVGGVSRRLGNYGSNVLRNSGRWQSIKGLRRARLYRVAMRKGVMKRLGQVHVVFARCKGQRDYRALVTDNFKLSAKSVIVCYLKRWAIEMLIRDQKQHLGLGDYRVLRYRAVVRHLHLVDSAYACLTHMGIQAHDAQGHCKKSKVLSIEPMSKLKERVRRVIWQENVKDVIKHSHEKPVIRRLEKLLAA